MAHLVLLIYRHLSPQPMREFLQNYGIKIVLPKSEWNWGPLHGQTASILPLMQCMPHFVKPVAGSFVERSSQAMEW